ncbi:LysR substrate-binding domain-containing protein [Xanthobacter variabilis]|uniref:LysR substrate-binding domain-containing protein n=1 Tax=Xanthobacter variabilis TaxID=3119932 RepID=UPI00372CFEBA
MAISPHFRSVWTGDRLGSGKLITLLDDLAPEERFWLVWPQSAHHSPKLRAFIDFCFGRLLPTR